MRVNQRDYETYKIELKAVKARQTNHRSDIIFKYRTIEKHISTNIGANIADKFYFK